MFDLLQDSRRVGFFAMTPGVTASLVVHLAVAGFMIYDRAARDSATGADDWTEVIEGLTYIAPPDVSSAASNVNITYQAGGGAEGDLPANAEEGDLRAQGQGTGDAAVASESSDDSPEQLAIENDDIFEDAFSSVEVESAAERDPTSAAPIYPRHLMELGVEGYAAMRFVVDTLGRVEVGSVRVLDATHPEFAAAVRAAMPLMKFAPARLGDRPVRQLAEQLFRFQILKTVEEPPNAPVIPTTTSAASSGVRRPR